MVVDLLGDDGPPVPNDLLVDLSIDGQPPEAPTDGKVYLRGRCEVVTPDYDMAFLQFGGSMNALTSDGRTQLSVSGATRSVTIENGEFAIELSTDKGHTFVQNDTLHLPSNATVRVHTSPVIVDAMMVVGEKVVGEGVAPLLDGLIKRQLIIPLTYQTWLAQYGTVALTNLYIERNGKSIDVQEVPSNVSLSDAEKVLIAYNTEATERRKVYYLNETEGLSKPVAFTPVGYMPLRHLFRRDSGLSNEGLESWLDSAIRIVVRDDAKVDALYTKFSSPKREPDNEAAHIVVNAFTTLMYSQSSYAYDGHVRITPQGVEHVNSEEWKDSPPESVVDTDDCDGGGMYGMSICHQLGIGAQAAAAFTRTSPQGHQLGIGAQAATAFTRTSPQGPAGRFCCNALFHYEPALAVTLASAGSGGELNDKPKLAGHATMLILPIAHFLEAIEQGTELDTLDADTASQMATHFEHFYPPEKREALGSTWTLQSAVQAFKTAEPFVGEGTILSNSRMYHQTRADRNSASLQLLAQKRKMRDLGSTLVACYHDLTTNAKTHAHEFYMKWVEITVMKSLQFDDKTASQFVLVRHPFKTSNKRVDSGTTPEQLFRREYALTPLAYEDRAVYNQMEKVYEEFVHHRMAPRTDRPLTEMQETKLHRNLQRFDDFAAFLETLPDTDEGMGEALTCMHALFPPRIFLGNNESVEHTLQKLKANVKAGTMRRFPIDSSLGYLADKSTGVFMCSAVLYM